VGQCSGCRANLLQNSQGGDDCEEGSSQNDTRVNVSVNARAIESSVGIQTASTEASGVVGTSSSDDVAVGGVGSVVVASVLQDTSSVGEGVASDVGGDSLGSCSASAVHAGEVHEGGAVAVQLAGVNVGGIPVPVLHWYHRGEPP